MSTLDPAAAGERPPGATVAGHPGRAVVLGVVLAAVACASPAEHAPPLVVGSTGGRAGSGGATAGSGASTPSGGTASDAGPDAPYQWVTDAGGDAAAHLDAGDAGSTGGATGADAGTGGTSATGGTGGTSATGGTGGGGGSASGGAAAVDAGPYDGPHFTDVTVAAGIDFVQSTSFACVVISAPSLCDAESPQMSGGAVAGDFDGDGLVDLFATRIEGPNLLYRNRGDGTFEEVAAAAGLDGVTRSNGAGAADVDNDGDLDLYVTAQGQFQNYLFINDGSGHFTELGVTRGASTRSTYVHEGTSVAFGDYDRDGWVDLFVGEWIPMRPPAATAAVRLLHNRGAAAPGYFEDVTAAAGLLLDPDAMQVVVFTPSFTDLDEDGWPDLAVAADFGTSRLYWNAGNGTFVNGTSASGVGTDENGMGSTIGDWDGDGHMDWFVTSIRDPANQCSGPDRNCNWGATGNRLYKNLGGRVFGDATDIAGVRNSYWGWGATFLDYDNDGDLDLAATNGFVVGFTNVEDPFNGQSMQLFRNTAGTMEDVAQRAGLSDSDNGKGIVAFDYDADGDQDLFIQRNGGTPRLFRNDGGNEQSWLRVRLVGTSSNRDGFGARVSVTRTVGGPPIVREHVGGANYLSQNEPVVAFGLGAGTDPIAELRIRWPRSGTEQVLTDVARNQTLIVTEP